MCQYKVSPMCFLFLPFNKFDMVQIQILLIMNQDASGSASSTKGLFNHCTSVAVLVSLTLHGTALSVQ